MRINREELAWAAGLFDGEGNIRTASYNKHLKGDSNLHMALRLTVAQSDRRVLDRFKEAVGGLGQVLGPYDHMKYGISRKPHFTFQAANFEAAQAIIAMLYPFLSPVKREQSLQALKQYNKWYVSVEHTPGRKNGENNDRMEPLGVGRDLV